MTDSGEKPAAGQAFHVARDDKVIFSKTVAESDIYLFAGITGDFSENHVNEEYMRASVFGRRVAHGALLVGFMSTASTMMIARSVAAGIDETPVALGYDRIRFIRPVYIGDTVTVTYTISAIDATKRRSSAKIEVTSQRGELVAVAEHILQWVRNPPLQP